jgi:ATP-binding cassette subfamily B protein
VGHTGAGKTTIINLLLRFYDIQRGSIRLGGVDLCEYDLHALRRYFGVVLQDPFLFTGTVESNIRLGDALDAERVAWAAEESGLSSSVALDTPVKERGLGLSTGQKQLVGCARALARDPRCVILDEATSSLDPHLDLTLRQAVERLTEQRTAIVIAHRLATIQSANRIFVMHRGQLRESGTHRELLALGGIYSRLYELQYKDPTGEPAAPQLA